MLGIDRSRDSKILQFWTWNMNFQGVLRMITDYTILQPGQMSLGLDNQGVLTTFAVLWMLAKRMGKSLLFGSKPLTPILRWPGHFQHITGPRMDGFRS